MDAKKPSSWVGAVLLAISLAGCSYLPGGKTAKPEKKVQTQGGPFQITVSRSLPDETQMPQAQAALEKQAVAQLQQHFMEQVVQPEQARFLAGLSAYEKRLLNKMKWQLAPLKTLKLPTFMPKVAYEDDTLSVTKEVDRAALAKALAARVADIDRALLAYRYVPDEQPRLVQIQYLLPAYPLLLERALYKRLLQRLPLDYTRRTQDAYAEMLLGKLQTLMRKYAIEVRANLQKDPTVETGLRTVLAEQGLNLRGMPDLFVLYDVQQQAEPMDEGVALTLQGQISLSDANEVPFDQFRYQIRKQSETEQLARAKAVREVTEKILQRIDRLLLKRYYVLQGVYQK